MPAARHFSRSPFLACAVKRHNDLVLSVALFFLSNGPPLLQTRPFPASEWVHLSETVALFHFYCRELTSDIALPETIILRHRHSPPKD